VAVTAGLCAAAIGVVGVVSVSSVNAKVAKTSSAMVMTLSDSRIVESSGLARSGLSTNRLWTVNDSGGGTTLFALDTQGRTAATYDITGASHKDWEAMARKTINGVVYLFIGDIGDNGKKRSSIFVHRVREPAPGTASGSLKPTTFEFRYPDGSHNAEAMMVQPGSQRIFIVTKGKKTNGGIYEAPATLSTTSVNTLRKVGVAPAGMSDALFLPNGSFILRGYVNGWLYKKVGATPVGFSLPLKGETIAFGPTTRSVVIGSEGRNSKVYQVALP
jgi:hypothetical protein